MTEALQKLLQSLVGRFVDTGNPTSKTNIATALGASLMSLALLMTQQPDIYMQGSGFVVGTVGFLMTLYKQK